MLMKTINKQIEEKIQEGKSIKQIEVKLQKKYLKRYFELK